MAPSADTVLGRELGEHIHEAMDDLSVEHRVVLSLFAVKGLGHAEIAGILGIPEGTVWSRLHHARRALAGALEPYLTGSTRKPV